MAPRASAPTWADSLATAGDVVLAGVSSPYEHLSPAPARPTLGRGLAAARRAAAGFDPAPTAEGRWRPVAVEPDSDSTGPHPRVQAVCLPPGGFAALPRRRHGESVVYLAAGEAHAVAVSAQGGLRTVRRLAPARGWVWAEPHHYHLINTGPISALLLHCD